MKSKNKHYGQSFSNVEKVIYWLKKKSTNFDLASTILFKTQNNKKNITYIFITLLLYIYIKNVKKNIYITKNYLKINSFNCKIIFR